MQDNRCVNFLRWALPRLHLRWQGFRRVRRQVCRRIDSRLGELGLAGVHEYRSYLQENPAEWEVLNRMCRVTISRFYRDRVIFDYFAADVLPVVTQHFRSKGHEKIRVWSCGCASGEEPYTVAILWHYRIRPMFPDVTLEIVATDIDPVLLKRARKACYRKSSLREMPAGLLHRAFTGTEDGYCLNHSLKQYVGFMLQNVRFEAPGGMFQLILCRNLALTYFDLQVQKTVLERLSRSTESGGVLITGRHELLAGRESDFDPWVEHLPIFRKKRPDNR